MYWKLGWREIERHPVRALLTLASVVIAVAGVVAVGFASRTARRAFDDIYQAVAGRADLEVSTEIGDTFEDRLLDKISKLPGVEAAAPLIQRPVIMYVGKKSVQLMALAIDSKLDPAIRDIKLEAGKTLAEEPGVMLHAALAKSLGVKVGDSVDLMTRLGNKTTHVVGLYTLHGVAAASQGVEMLMPLSAAQVLYRTMNRLGAIQIVLKPGADIAQVKAEISKLLPPGVTVQPPAARSQMAEETSLSTQQGLNMARAFSLLVSVFIIANTFLIAVTQLRKQLGIMRAIGATRRQVALLVFQQALLMGLIGTILGSVVGVVVAHYLNHAMGELYVTTLPPIKLTPAPFIWAAAIGLIISMLGAALPARKASHSSPMEAIRDTVPGANEGVARGLVLTGGIMVVVCSAILAASIRGSLSMEIAVWGAVLLLIGMVLMLPIALPWLSQVASWVLRPWMWLEARLARRQLLRHRSRTTLTVGVVFIAISTGIGLANSVIDNVQNVRDWYHKTIIVDFYLRATGPSMATGLAADMPDTIDAEVKQIPYITASDTSRFMIVKAAGKQVSLIIRGYDNDKLQMFDLVSGDPTTVRESLKKGETVIGSVLAQRTKLKVGDDITMQTRNGDEKFRIAAVVNDYQAGGLTMYLDREFARKLFDIGGVDAYLINADPAHKAEVRDALQKVADKYGLELRTSSDVQQKIDSMMSGVVAGLWGMVFILLLVAAFGVANTLMMAVLEQTREFGLLRVVAMTRGQIRKTIFAQALVIGLLALVPGVFAGVGVAYLIHLATQPVIGHPVKFETHPMLMVGGLVFGLLIVVVAAWVPAERASRLELTTALRMG